MRYMSLGCVEDPKKKTPVSAYMTREKCGISGAPVGCTHIICWVKILNKLCVYILQMLRKFRIFPGHLPPGSFFLGLLHIPGTCTTFLQVCGIGNGMGIPAGWVQEQPNQPRNEWDIPNFDDFHKISYNSLNSGPEIMFFDFFWRWQVGLLWPIPIAADIFICDPLKVTGRSIVTHALYCWYLYPWPVWVNRTYAIP